MLISSLLIVLGLAAFETVSSIDNAVINAEVLATLSPSGKRWFLRWGLLIAVVGVRGLLPWAIVWATLPSLGPWKALTAAFSGDPQVAAAVALAAPALQAAGGIFLVLLFIDWILTEEKAFSWFGERLLLKPNAFGAVGVAAVLIPLWLACYDGQFRIAWGIGAGALVFAIAYLLKGWAQRQESKMLRKGSSDTPKLLYLEAIDAVFSVDGVLGAFAFTLSVPLILIGNGIGALVVRELTVRQAAKIGLYPYLKNGAMYAIFVLAAALLAEASGRHVPEWWSPLATIVLVGYFFWRSRAVARLTEETRAGK
jgi:hypothetical protein